MTTFTTEVSDSPTNDIPEVVIPAQLLTGIVFTSREEVSRLYSTIGVDLRLDDMDISAGSNHMNEVVLAATETVSSFTMRYYNNSAIYTSPWIRRRATIIAAYYLSMRRANGTQFTQEYQRVMEDLEKFLTDKPPMIPGNDGFPAPVRTSNIPTVSAYKVDDRNRVRKLRVVKDYSTKPYPGQYGYVNPLSSDYL